MTRYIGTVTLNGRTTVELEVFPDKRHRGSWFLYRTSNGSRDRLRSAAAALAYGSDLNPKIEWKQAAS